ncbi:MAG TPA: aminotransferase class I/II-fold pyridoxal phosphate-dependent enzyme [Candidatus Absconditabacterales bacterium]|nr:aminotransferase class I/II-fold pyridoxal phosphate-dependent enzyme [Candidatus Absconditabacterales bacterium]
MTKLSSHFQNRKPSSIRMAQIEFLKRTDNVQAINVSIGDVSLPMHPKMQERMFHLQNEESPFKKGIVPYSLSKGYEETNNAFINIIAASGYDTTGLYSQITDGGSLGMELIIVGCCGPAGSKEQPLLLIDAAYTNYMTMANRVGRSTISVRRNLQKDGKFTLPDITELEKTIKENRPGALVVIPYDNPTGHFYDQESMITLAQLCVKYDLWMISDEAYRELFYVNKPATSIRGITNKDVPGIEGRRISIETASKVRNACGLRVGALVTDNKEFHEKSIAEYTANLCTNVIGQYIFGALANESKEDLQLRYKKQREYYKEMLETTTNMFKESIPGIIISSPEASLYSVIDVRDIAKQDFDANEFVFYCASKGQVQQKRNGKMENLTLLVAPMTCFYSSHEGEKNPGKTQMRIAYILSPEEMKLVPTLFKELFEQFEKNR